MQLSVKQDRHRYLGASDIAAVLEISPFKSRWRLLQEKCQLVEPETFESVYMTYGNTMESKIRDYVNDTYNYGFVEGRHYDEENHIRFHTDGEDITLETVLEVKTTSQIKDNVRDYDYYLCQLIFEMSKLRWKKGVLAVYDRPEDLSEEFEPERLHVYFIDINDFREFESWVMSGVERFMDDWERLKADPFLTESDFLPKDMVTLSDSILALENTLDAMKSIEADIKNRKQRLFDLMVENRVKTWATERFRLTRVDEVPAHMETEEELDLKALERDLPELFKTRDEGGYIVEKQVKKSGHKGYVKITKLNGGLTDE